MDELRFVRHVKMVSSYGIPKHTAKEIVADVMEMNVQDIERALKYAIDLMFGFGLTQKQDMKQVSKF